MRQITLKCLDKMNGKHEPSVQKSIQWHFFLFLYLFQSIVEIGSQQSTRMQKIAKTQHFIICVLVCVIALAIILALALDLARATVFDLTLALALALVIGLAFVFMLFLLAYMFLRVRLLVIWS